MTPSESSVGTEPCRDSIVISPPLCTSPPARTLTATVGVSVTWERRFWTVIAPPAVESVFMSASVCDSAISLTAPEAVTWPAPNWARTSTSTLASETDGGADSIVTRPKLVLSIFVTARSAAEAVTSIVEAPATPHVPATPSGPKQAIVVPTLPLSWALVVAWMRAFGSTMLTVTRPNWLDLVKA